MVLNKLHWEKKTERRELEEQNCKRVAKVHATGSGAVRVFLEDTI